MKYLKTLFLLLIVTSILQNCKKDDDNIIKNKLAGTYKGTSMDNNAKLIISSTSVENEVKITLNYTDFNQNAFENLKATTKGDSIFILEQIVDSNSVYGSGALSGNQMNLDISEKSGIFTFTTHFSGIKQ